MFKTIARKFDSWKAYNRTVRELSSLTNRDLHDLGITRAEIQSLAKRHATDNL